MAMSFGNVSKMSVGEVVTGIATEGGALVGGLLGAGIIGKQIEKNIGTAGSKNVIATSTITDKVIGYVMNNGPKVAVWYYMQKEGIKLGGYEKDVQKGIVASVALDTVIRATNTAGFLVPKNLVQIGGIDVLTGERSPAIVTTNPQMQENMQRVLQENSSLRGQLNSAMQRLASAPSSTPVNVTATPIQRAPIQQAPIQQAPVQQAPIIRAMNQPQVIAAPPADHDRRFGMMGEPEDRRKNYGAMTSPIEEERNRNFGAMNKAKLNFAGETENMASAYGML